MCGVSNCGAFEPGMYGSCCAEASPPIYKLEKIPGFRAQGGNTEWSPWYQDDYWGKGWGRQRWRVNGSKYVIQRQELN